VVTLACRGQLRWDRHGGDVRRWSLGKGRL